MRFDSDPKGSVSTHRESSKRETPATIVRHLAGATFEVNGHLGYDRVLSPNRRPYRTQDGWLAVLPYTYDQWRRFLLEVERHDILDAP